MVKLPSRSAGAPMTYLLGPQSSYPLSCIVYIEATFPSGDTFTGSGVLVGENDILTAAHLLYDVGEGGAAISVTVFPGYDDGVAPFGSYQGGYSSYYQVDLDGDGLLSRLESQYDVAIIGLSTPLGSQLGWFGLQSGSTAGNYNLTGYPGVFAGFFGPHMTNDYGFATVSSSYWVFDYQTIESNPGNSGGPLWFETANGPFVVGVASTSGWAADITFTFDQIQQWISANDYLVPVHSEPPGYVLEVGRLYEAGLGRAFDTGGLNFWIDAHQDGMDLWWISWNFLESAEFNEQHGDDDLMSNSRFLDVLYQNVLNRAPDPTGFAWWLNEMNNGYGHERALISFSNSAESTAIGLSGGPSRNLAGF